MKDYNSIPFKNAAIDRMSRQFGKGDPKGQTVKPVTVRPSAEQVSRVKGRMESDINRMDAEIKGYEYATPKSVTGLTCSMKNDNCSKETRDAYREVVTKDALSGSNKFVGKNIQSTREAYQGAKKAHSYAKANFYKP
jgi:hypothetical protein